MSAAVAVSPKFHHATGDNTMSHLGDFKHWGTDGARLEPGGLSPDREPADDEMTLSRGLQLCVCILVMLVVFGCWFVVFPVIGLLWCFGLL